LKTASLPPSQVYADRALKHDRNGHEPGDDAGWTRIFLTVAVGVLSPLLCHLFVISDTDMDD
jgi:hypothetical protein